MRDWEFALAGLSERHVQPSSGRLWVHGFSVGDKPGNHRSTFIHISGDRFPLHDCIVMATQVNHSSNRSGHR